MKLLKPWTWFSLSKEPLSSRFSKIGYEKLLPPGNRDIEELAWLESAIRMARKNKDQKAEQRAWECVHEISCAGPTKPRTYTDLTYSDLAELDSWITTVRDSRRVGDKKAEDVAWRNLVQLTEGKTLIQQRIADLEKLHFGMEMRVFAIENKLGIKRTV